jgi:hypothetical protein
MRSRQKWIKIFVWFIVVAMVLSLAVAIIPAIGG